MASGSSTAANGTLPFSFFFHCSGSRAAFLVSTSFSAVKTGIILPCALLVLHLGRRRRGPRRHADVLSYNMVLFDLLFVAGALLFLCGTFSALPPLSLLGFHLSLLTFPGPVLLHILACLERYLAVVQPVTYLALRRGTAGARIRNGLLGGVWLLSCGWSAAGTRTLNSPFLPTFLLLGSALLLVTLSSLRVLCVLLRPKPGPGARSSQGARLGAFQTMAAITGAMWMWFLGVLVSLALSTDQGPVEGCVLLVCGYWFTLPSTLVLPLLLLRTARKHPARQGTN